MSRYLDIFWTFSDSFYNSVFKVLFLLSSGYTLYLMTNRYKPTHDPNLDTFRVSYLTGGSAVLAILFPYRYALSEILWAFSLWLESVAILPQLFMLQRTGEAETITTHYLFALGIYRALYIPNWIYRWFAEGHFDPIPVVAGIIQTVLYSDFFWVYYTKSATPLPLPLGRWWKSHGVLTRLQGAQGKELQTPRLMERFLSAAQRPGVRRSRDFFFFLPKQRNKGACHSIILGEAP